MEWSEIDFDARSWKIPGVKAKAGKSIIVALTPGALRVLHRLYQDKGDSRFCFPSRSETGHVVNLSKAWNTVRERSGFGDDVCLYGFAPHSFDDVWAKRHVCSGADEGGWSRQFKDER